jgi:glycerol uptake facilitator protein
LVKFAWSQVATYVLAQMIGAMLELSSFGSHKDHFAATDDEAEETSLFFEGPAIRNYSSNLISEIIGTLYYFCYFISQVLM